MTVINSFPQMVYGSSTIGVGGSGAIRHPMKAIFRCPDTARSLTLEGEALKTYLHEENVAPVNSLFCALVAGDDLSENRWSREFCDLGAIHERYNTNFQKFSVSVKDKIGGQDVINDCYVDLVVYSYSENDGTTGGGGGGGDGLINVPFVVETVSLMSTAMRNRDCAPSQRAATSLENRQGAQNAAKASQTKGADDGSTQRQIKFILSERIAYVLLTASLDILLSPIAKKIDVKIPESETLRHIIRMRIVSKMTTIWDSRTITGTKIADLLEYTERDLLELNRKIVNITNNNVGRLNGCYAAVEWRFTREANLICELALSQTRAGLSSAPKRILFKNNQNYASSVLTATNNSIDLLGNAKTVVLLNAIPGYTGRKEDKSRTARAGFSNWGDGDKS